MPTLQSRAIPNLIMGVSQQAAEQRRDSQCEAQFDCINSPQAGAVARNGAELVKFFNGLDLTGCWTHEIFRGDEHYLLTLKAGVLRAYNLDTGVECAITVTGAAGDYLANTSGLPDKNAYRAQTVDDYTFLAKRNTPPAMAATVSETRPHEALLFFHAGAYLSDYNLSLTRQNGNTLGYTYVTPDNSLAYNAIYIGTTQLAATFYRALTGDPSNGGDAGNSQGYFDPTTDHTTHTPSQLYAPAPATDHGYSVSITGNVIRIWRDDGLDFGVSVSDGQGGGGMEAFKDTVATLTDLPKGGFDGFVLGVKANNATATPDGATGSDFFVKYTGNYVTGSNTSGYWQESTGQNVPTNIDPVTMPHAIVSTGINAFEVKQLVWSSRIVGDGVNSAQDPGFIGKGIEDLFYDHQRLGIITQSSVTFSKARNEFTFFPDTIQAILADAPIDIQLAGSEAVAILQRKLQVDEGLFLWAQRAQFRVSQGNNAVFAEDTVQAPETTSYEFSAEANFAKVASTVYFATEVDDYAAIRALPFSGGRSAGDTEVSSHVPEYIPTGITQLTISDTGQLLFVRSDGQPNYLYLYNYLVEGQQIVQSSWNTWRLPIGSILWCSIRLNTLYVFHQRQDGLAFTQVPLSYYAKDTPADAYRTRMDLRVDDTVCTTTYDVGVKETTITLPYQLVDGEKPMVVTRSTAALVRGREFTVKQFDGSTLVVLGNATTTPFYAGLRISAERTESEFFIRSKDGVTPTDRLVVRKFRVSVDKTGYTRIEADQGANRTKVSALLPNVIGTSLAVLGSPPILARGDVEIPTDSLSKDLTITLINDSFLPSRWQTAEYQYEATYRAKPSAA